MLIIEFIKYPHSILLKPILSDLLFTLRYSGELLDDFDEDIFLNMYSANGMLFTFNPSKIKI
jgi:hypothetical protein